MAYNQEAELYWNNLLNRFSCTPENIRTIQFDFSSDPDYQAALQLASAEQRAEYEDICRTCTYNLRLQYGLNSAVHSFIESHQNGTADEKLQNQKKQLEDDMKKIKKKIPKAWWMPLPFIGLAFGIIDFIVMLLITVFYEIDSGHDMSDFVAGCFFFSTIFIVMAYVLQFSYFLLYDILYNIFMIIYAFVWFMVAIVQSNLPFVKPVFIIIYWLPMFVIPLIVFLSTFPWKFARRLKRDKLLEQYANDLEWFETATDGIVGGYENYMNGLYAEYSSRKSSPDAFLVLSQEAYDYRDSLKQKFAKELQSFEDKKPK